MDQTLILIDEKDNFLGYASLEECHKNKGKLHRAFVTFLFDNSGQILLQRRKHRLFDKLWDGFCSHNLKLDGGDESYQEASDRTLKKEMGIGHVVVKKVGAFNYFAKDGENCENEYCAILTGKYDGQYQPNQDAVYEAKQMAFEEFLVDVKANPQKYTPWAVLAVKQLKTL